MFDVNAFSVKYSLRVYTDVISTKSNIKFLRIMSKKGNAAKIHIQKTTVVDMEFCICYNKVKATPHKDHLLDFVRVLLASFPSYCTIRPCKAWSPPVGEVSTQVDRGVDRQTSLAASSLYNLTKNRVLPISEA